MPEINISLFSQCLQLLDRVQFQSLVKKHQSDKYTKGINSWTHLVAMIFCHMAKSASVREISDGLRSAAGNLNHLGVARSPCKSSMSYINSHRSWELFKDYYFALLDRYETSLAKRRKYGYQLKRKIFLQDSTTISLCLSLFNWAKFRAKKGAIKLHTVLDYDTALPVFLHLTEGKMHDSKITDMTRFPVGSVVVMDRGFFKLKYLNNLDSSGVFFVTRLKDQIDFSAIEDLVINPNYLNIISDQKIILQGERSSTRYPGMLRKVSIYDPQKKQHLNLLTNNFSWTADTISKLYKARWDIEIFFKQIKQVLRVKTFVGTSANAVLIQVWTAMITMLILRYLQNRAKHKWHLSNLAAMVRTHLFSKIEMMKWLDSPFAQSNSPPGKFPLLDLI